MADYIDGYWQSADGLKLHYRDYPGSDSRPPLLCLPGLTRNARDFALLADRLAGNWRLVCAELRGRGESAPARDPMTYVPDTYVEDLEGLIAHLGLGRLAIVGTSLGGLIAMRLAINDPGRIAGVVLNDIGPVIERAGLDRIRANVGGGGSQPTWVHAARAIAEVQGGQFPDYKLQDWLAMAKRACRLNSQGRIVFDYDMRIAEPFKAGVGGAGGDLWPAMDALKGKPVLIVRGALSDLFSAATAEAMLERIGPSAEIVTVPRVGHAPTLDGPAVEGAIDAWLARLT